MMMDGERYSKGGVVKTTKKDIAVEMRVGTA